MGGGSTRPHRADRQRQQRARSPSERSGRRRRRRRPVAERSDAEPPQRSPAARHEDPRAHRREAVARGGRRRFACPRDRVVRRAGVQAVPRGRDQARPDLDGTLSPRLLQLAGTDAAHRRSIPSRPDDRDARRERRPVVSDARRAAGCPGRYRGFPSRLRTAGALVRPARDVGGGARDLGRAPEPPRHEALGVHPATERRLPSRRRRTPERGVLRHVEHVRRTGRWLHRLLP